jgi:hypothetical protein
MARYLAQLTAKRRKNCHAARHDGCLRAGMRNTVVCLLSAAMAIGCGGSTIDPAGTGGAGAASGGSGGAAASGGTSGFGGAGGAGALGGSGAVAGSGGSACSDFHDETSPSQGITIRLINNRPTPIFFGDPYAGCGPVPHYALSGPNGPVQLYAGGCGNTCQALQEHPDYCAGACMIPPVLQIMPGGYYDAGWTGMAFESANMPLSCYFDQSFAPASCDRRIVAPGGNYVVTAQAFPELICDALGMCSCEPDPSGACEIPYGANPSGTPIEGKASFEMPSATMVQISFE